METRRFNHPCALADVRPSQHIGWFYTDVESYRRGLTAFIRDGGNTALKHGCVSEIVHSVT